MPQQAMAQPVKFAHHETMAVRCNSACVVRFDIHSSASSLSTSRSRRKYRRYSKIVGSQVLRHVYGTR